MKPASDALRSALARILFATPEVATNPTFRKEAQNFFQSFLRLAATHGIHTTRASIGEIQQWRHGGALPDVEKIREVINDIAPRLVQILL